MALLRLASFDLPAGSALRVQRLEDAVLLHTGQNFGAEPEALVRSVRSIVGAALDQHQDERGIFLIPDVAAPRARTYAGVIAEVGEGGMWGPMAAESVAQPAGLGFEAALGSMLSQLPSGLMDSLAQAATSGDMAALQQASMGLQHLMHSNPQLAGLAHELERSAQPTAQEPVSADDMLARLGIDMQSPALAAMLGGGGVDIDSPAFAQLMSQVQAQLASDPSMLMSLAEQFLGSAQSTSAPPRDDDDES